MQFEYFAFDMSFLALCSYFKENMSNFALLCALFNLSPPKITAHFFVVDRGTIVPFSVFDIKNQRFALQLEFLVV